MAKNLKQELQNVNKEIKALSKKIEKIIVAVDKIGTAKPAKKAAPKKAEKLTAPEAVMKIINRSRKGVDAASLKEKTGFKGPKLHNVVYKLKKQGKIKSERPGVYTKA